MELPLIKRIKNEFLFIHKNFSNVNRYKSIINKFNLISSTNTSRNYNTELFNFQYLNHNKSKKELISKTRNNNTFQKNILDNKIASKLNIIKKKKNIYFFSLPPSKDNNSSDFSLPKNKNKSFYHSSLNFDSSLSEKRSLKTNKSNPNFIFSQKKNEFSNIDKILTKYKLNKIISNNSMNNCYIQDIKNKQFLDGYRRTIFSDKFIKRQINKHRRFIFDKNENHIQKLNKYLISLDEPNNNYNLTTKEIINSLSKKDIKLIKTDISYFKNIDANIIKELTKIKSNKICLADILNNEEKNNNREEFINETIKEKVKINTNKLNKNKNFLINYDKYINKLTNEDFNKRLKEIQIKKPEKFENVLNDCSSKINIVLAKLNNERNFYNEDKCFRTFLNNLDEEMTKKYSINRNRERLLKVKKFQNKKKIPK